MDDDLNDRTRWCCPSGQARGGPQCQEKDTERTAERMVHKYVDDVNYRVMALNGLKDDWTDVDGDVIIRLCCTILQYR
jgi:hypothetical protein